MNLDKQIKTHFDFLKNYSFFITKLSDNFDTIHVYENNKKVKFRILGGWGLNELDKPERFIIDIAYGNTQHNFESLTNCKLLSLEEHIMLQNNSNNSIEEQIIFLSNF